MADLAAVAGNAGQRLAVDDEPPPTPTSPADEHDVSRRGPRRGGARRAPPRSASLAKAIGTSSPSASVSRSPSGTSRQPRFGAIETMPSLRRTMPTTATPTPTIDVGDRQSRGPARPGPPRAATMSSTLERPRGQVDAHEVDDLAAEADRRPPRASRRRSRAPARPRRRGRGGRAATAGRACRRASRGPRSRGRPATSSPISPRIALAGQAGARHEVGARQRAAAVQLTDDRAEVRPANGLAAVSELVATDQHEVCVPLSQMLCVDSSQRRGHVNTDGEERDDGDTVRWGILSTASIATTKVIPGIRKADHCEIVAIASRDAEAARRVAGEPRDPDGPRLVRGAPRRPGRGCGLHPAAEPPPRRVDDRRGAGRQARPVREATGA